MSHNIPETQWAQVIEKTGGPVQYKQIPVQKPGPDEVLVNIKYSGVCHTDLHALNGDWPLDTKLPLVGGHEGAGIVVARGDLVTDIEIGDKAGVKVRLSLLCCVPASPQYPYSPRFAVYAYRLGLLTRSLDSGSTVAVSRVPSASRPMSRSAKRPYSPDTLSMVHSSNIVSQKLHMLHVSPRTSRSMRLLRSFAQVSPSIRD